MRTPHLARVLAFLPVAAAPACTNATGGVSGGDPLVTDPCAGQTTHTWTDLYACYFGPTGTANCSSQSICHLASTSEGSMASAFTCGTSKDDCWRGMTQGTNAIAPANASNVSDTGLFIALRKAVNGKVVGTMPCNPQTSTTADGGTTVTCSANQGTTFAFAQSDLDRIAAWIGEGAQDN